MWDRFLDRRYPWPRVMFAPEGAVIASSGNVDSGESEESDESETEETGNESESKAEDNKDAEDESQDDFAKWFHEQPDDIRQQIAEKYASGELKRAVDSERKKAREAERELKRIEREREMAETQKAKDEGRWKDLAEKNEQRAKELEARIEAQRFADEARSRLKEEGLSDFEDVLMGSRESVDDIVESGKRINELIDKVVDKRVAERLETGRHNRSGRNGAPEKNYQEMTEAERSAYADEHGYEALQEKIRKDLRPAAR